MKKIISVLLILAALFAFTACEPEASPAAPSDEGPGIIDTTTLDGVYVQTVNQCGKPANMYTYVISGNTITAYHLSLYHGYETPTEESLAAATQVEMYSDTITPHGTSFDWGTDETWSMTTDASGTWIMEDGNDIRPPLQKVAAGRCGTPLYSEDFYLTAGKALSIETDLSGDVSYVMLFIGQNSYESEEADKTGNTIAVTGLEDSSGPMTDGACTITLDGNTAVVSGVENFTGQDDPAGTYTKYTRTTPWPAMPVAE